MYWTVEAEDVCYKDVMRTLMKNLMKKEKERKRDQGEYFLIFALFFCVLKLKCPSACRKQKKPLNT